MTINRYRYFYACAFSMFEGHLVTFIDEMVELDHAENTVKIYLSSLLVGSGPERRARSLADRRRAKASASCLGS
jgi:hypothetical protein